MGRMRQVDLSGLYEGVLERLALALEEAERDGKEPVELEVQGLSDGELAFIRAYLQRDANWLSGWHAAASEQARLSRQSRSGSRRVVDGPLPASTATPRQRLALDCALCGSAVPWPRRPGLVVCSACGSALIKAVHPEGHDPAG